MQFSARNTILLLIAGNTSTNDLGGGIWDFWYGPSGRSGGLPPLNLLVPKIASSSAAKAMAYSGIRLNLTRMGEMQQAAEITCDQSSSKKIPCNAYNTPCLFNVEEDPCELYNVADRYPNIVDRLKFLIDEQNRTALPPLKRLAHPEAFPRNHGNVWTTWESDEDEENDITEKTEPSEGLPPTLVTTSLTDSDLLSTGQPFKNGADAGPSVNYWVGIVSILYHLSVIAR